MAFLRKANTKLGRLFVKFHDKCHESEVCEPTHLWDIVANIVDSTLSRRKSLVSSRH